MQNTYAVSNHVRVISMHLPHWTTGGKTVSKQYRGGSHVTSPDLTSFHPVGPVMSLTRRDKKASRRRRRRSTWGVGMSLGVELKSHGLGMNAIDCWTEKKHAYMYLVFHLCHCRAFSYCSSLGLLFTLSLPSFFAPVLALPI